MADKPATTYIVSVFEAVFKDCGDTTLNKSHAEFCAMAKKMGG
nr:hypothetical protein [Mesorhizobium sp. dw_380]